MNIRKATTSDLPHLVAFDTVTRGLERRIDEIKSAIVHGQCWVYAEKAPPTGYAIFENNFFGRPFVRLLFVANDHRRKGIASRLVQHLETVGGQDRMFVSANQSNAAMRALLERLGYHQCGEIHGLDEGDAELVFMKKLG